MPREENTHTQTMYMHKIHCMLVCRADIYDASFAVAKWYGLLTRRIQSGRKMWLKPWTKETRTQSSPPSLLAVSMHSIPLSS